MTKITLDKYELYLYNDSINGFEYVIETLIKELDMGLSAAITLTMKVHHIGYAVVNACHKELADTYKKKLNDCGLKVSIKQI